MIFSNCFIPSQCPHHSDSKYQVDIKGYNGNVTHESPFPFINQLNYVELFFDVLESPSLQANITKAILLLVSV